MPDHRRLLRRLRARVGLPLAVKRRGGLWRVFERIAGRVLAGAPTRVGALNLAAARARP